MHRGSVLQCFQIAVEVDVIELVRECVISKLPYVDDLVLMSEAIKGFRNKFLKWKEDFESKDLKVNLGKTKVMVSGGITKDGMTKK